MNKDCERANVSFHNRAGTVLNELFREFKSAITGIDRQRDENVFQQQVGKYTSQLKHNLDVIAGEMLNRPAPGINRQEWNHTLSSFIDQYIQEFRQKAKSL